MTSTAVDLSESVLFSHVCLWCVPAVGRGRSSGSGVRGRSQRQRSEQKGERGAREVGESDRQMSASLLCPPLLSLPRVTCCVGCCCSEWLGSGRRAAEQQSSSSSSRAEKSHALSILFKIAFLTKVKR